jgi:preprotein translocase subunit SecB
MEASKSMLKFSKYYIEDIKFTTFKENSMPKNGTPINIDFKYKATNFQQKEDKSLITVALEIALFKDYEKPPFSLNLIVAGVFESNTVLEKEEFTKTWLSSSLAILFPYVRETVSYITKNSNCPHLLLPPINIIETLKQQEEAKVTEK